MELRTKIQLAPLDSLVWTLLAVFFIASALFTPTFLSMKNQLDILYQSAMLGLLVLGMGIVMMMGEPDLLMETILAFTPGVAVLAIQQLSLGPVVCISMTLALDVAVGFFNDFFVTKVKTDSLLLTMSSQIVVRGLVLFLVLFPLAGLDEGYTFLGRGRIGSFRITILALIIVYIIFEFIFHKTVFRHKLALTDGSRRAACISGINTDRIIICAFMLAGLLSAVTGLVITGRQNAVSNSMGESMVMMAFVGTILGGHSFSGGMGKPVGMLGGTLLLGVIDNTLNLNGVDVSLVSATKGGLIFLAIILDRLHSKMGADIIHKKSMRKLVQNNS